jgi:DNA-binding transcriptional MerR regulator
MHRIEAAARLTGVSTHTLRYYEAEGILPPVGRDASGHRRYSDHDLGWVQFVRMLKGTGMGIADIQAFVAAERSGDGGQDVKLRLLSEHRVRVTGQMRTLAACAEKLDQKIAYYGGKIQHHRNRR